MFVPPFPSYAGGSSLPPGGSIYRGELVCFAVNNTASSQIAWNELTGTATVVTLAGPGSTEIIESYQYNAWAFAALTCLGGATNCTNTDVAPDNASAPFGTPGIMPLTGLYEFGNYDACPVVNIENFMPNRATILVPGGTRTTIENDLHVVSCYQDLREEFNLHLTQLSFLVSNSLGEHFFGAYQCVSSVNTVRLLSSADPYLVNATLFDFATLKTLDARFAVQGAGSEQCPSTENTELLGVVSSTVINSSFTNGTEPDQIGSDTSGAGFSSARAPIEDPSGLAGAVWWGPFPGQ